MHQRDDTYAHKAHMAIVTAIIVLGVLLRVYQIESELEVDELFSVKTVSSSWSHLIDASIKDRNHPPLHHVLLFFWIKAFGNSEISVRVVSVLASAVFLFVLHRVASRITTHSAALFVLLIGAISPFFVYYGQQARVYSLVTCFATLSFYFLMKSQEKPDSPRWKVLYGISCAALIYSQYMSVLIIGPQLFAIAAFKLHDKGKLIVYGLTGTLSILIWLYIVGVGVNPADVAITFWLSKPDWADLPSFYLQIFGLLPIAGTARILMIILALLLASILISWKNIRWAWILSMVFLIVFPVTTIWLISRYGPISVWAPRQLIGSAVAFICLVGVAIGLHRRWAGIALGSALVIWCVLALPDAFPEHTKTPWKMIVGLLDENADNYEIVAVDNWVADPLRFYSKRNNIFGWREWESRLGKTERVLFVCRPIRCDELKKFDGDYKATNVTQIKWKREKEAPSSTIQISYLEKLPPSNKRQQTNDSSVSRPGTRRQALAS